VQIATATTIRTNIGFSNWEWGEKKLSGEPTLLKGKGQDR